jgi:hypothetical protein
VKNLCSKRFLGRRGAKKAKNNGHITLTIAIRVTKERKHKANGKKIKLLFE